MGVKFSAVVCVGMSCRDMAIPSIKALQLLSNCDLIYCITSKNNFYLKNKFSRDIHPNITFLDEDKIIPGVNLDDIKQYLLKRIGCSMKAGWYFQQFLKMAFSRLSICPEYYLVWEADTILLKNADFIDEEGRIKITIKNEYNHPYFRTLKNILNLEKQCEYSFISEHMVFARNIMQEILQKINMESNDESSWVWNIMDAIESHDLPNSGFSEYETYGSYVAKFHPSSFVLSDKITTRSGAAYFGRPPFFQDINLLLLTKYFSASFESWQPINKNRHLIARSVSLVLLAIMKLVAPFHECIRKNLETAIFITK
jgi:hypothetical protein